MGAYSQWLQGVRRRAAVRSRWWRWVENTVSGASDRWLRGMAVVLATAAILGAAIAIATTSVLPHL